MKSHLVGLVLSVALLRPAPPACGQVLPARAPAEAVEISNDLATKLVDAVIAGNAQPDTNDVISPVGVAAALIQLRGTASAKVQDEIDELLRNYLSQTQLNAGFRDLLHDVQFWRERNKTGRIRTGRSGVSISNSLWISAPNRFSPLALEQNADYFHSKLFALRTAGIDLKAVEQQLGVESDLSLNEFRDQVRNDNFALISATNYGCRLAFPFENHAVGDFKLASGTTKRVTFVSRMHAFPYVKAEKFQAIDAGCGLRIFLPNDGVTVAEVWRLLSGWKNGEDLLGPFRTQPVLAVLPQFRVEAKYDLAPQLKSSGLPTLFGDLSALKSLTTNPLGAKLNRVLQRNFVEFDGLDLQAGSIAYSGGVAGGMLGGVQPIRFIADRPFIFTISTSLGSHSPVLLFIGTVANPGELQILKRSVNDEN